MSAETRGIREAAFLEDLEEIIAEADIDQPAGHGAGYSVSFEHAHVREALTKHFPEPKRDEGVLRLAWLGLLGHFARLGQERAEARPSCQLCGGEVQGWTCQACFALFEEDAEGRLVLDKEAMAQPSSFAPIPAGSEVWVRMRLATDFHSPNIWPGMRWPGNHTPGSCIRAHPETESLTREVEALRAAGKSLAEFPFARVSMDNTLKADLRFRLDALDAALKGPNG